MGVYMPEIEGVRERLLQYIARREEQGRRISLAFIGQAIDRSAASISNFIHRKDQGDVEGLAQRIRAYLDREEAKDVGKLLQVPFVRTRQAEAILEAIAFAHRYGRMVAVCGRPGFGKSRAIAEAVKQDPNLIVIQASRVLGPSGLLQELCEPLRESDKGLLRALVRRIRARLASSGRCVIVDDAHTLGFAALDVLRTIYDATGVGIVLVGIMALKRHLTGTSEEMEQLASRVAGRIWELPEFNEADLHLLLQAVIRPDDLAAALELFGHDKQLQSSARRTCNILEIAGRLALSSGGGITIQHLTRALKAA